MAMIRLTGIANPDLDDGQPHPVYIDPSRVLVIVRGSVRHPKATATEERYDGLQNLWEATRQLKDMVDKYIPNMEDPTAVGWMVTAREAAYQVREAYECASKAMKAGDYYPDVPCTEVQLACGTGLEHGVMLAKVYVQETPEQVAYEVAAAL